MLFKVTGSYKKNGNAVVALFEASTAEDARSEADSKGIQVDDVGPASATPAPAAPPPSQPRPRAASPTSPAPSFEDEDDATVDSINILEDDEDPAAALAAAASDEYALKHPEPAAPSRPTGASTASVASGKPTATRKPAAAKPGSKGPLVAMLGIIFVVVLGAGGAGYYFMIHEPGSGTTHSAGDNQTTTTGNGTATATDTTPDATAPVDAAPVGNWVDFNPAHYQVEGATSFLRLDFSALLDSPLLPQEMTQNVQAGLATQSPIEPADIGPITASFIDQGRFIVVVRTNRPMTLARFLDIDGEAASARMAEDETIGYDDMHDVPVFSEPRTHADFTYHLMEPGDTPVTFAVSQTGPQVFCIAPDEASMQALLDRVRANQPTAHTADLQARIDAHRDDLLLVIVGENLVQMIYSQIPAEARMAVPPGARQLRLRLRAQEVLHLHLDVEFTEAAQAEGSKMMLEGLIARNKDQASEIEALLLETLRIEAENATLRIEVPLSAEAMMALLMLAGPQDDPGFEGFEGSEDLELDMEAMEGDDDNP